MTMEAIRLSLPNYYIVIGIEQKILSFVCEETKMEADMDPTRIYDIPDVEVKSVDLLGEYIHIYFVDKTFYQVKLQSNSEIIIDHFTIEGELITEIGAWDFWD